VKLNGLSTRHLASGFALGVTVLGVGDGPLIDAERGQIPQPALHTRRGSDPVTNKPTGCYDAGYPKAPTSI